MSLSTPPHAEIEASAIRLMRKVAYWDIPQLLNALDVLLIDPHHISRLPHATSIDSQLRFLAIGIRHLLWKAYDAHAHTDKDIALIIQKAEKTVTKQISMMLSQNNDHALRIAMENHERQQELDSIPIAHDTLSSQAA